MVSFFYFVFLTTGGGVGTRMRVLYMERIEQYNYATELLPVVSFNYLKITLSVGNESQLH